MIRWLRSLFAWRDVRQAGKWLYQENAVSGARRVVPAFIGGISPINSQWLKGGAW
jgi:hypothetical protein